MVKLVALYIVSLEVSFQEPSNDISEDLLYNICFIYCSPPMDCKLLEDKTLFSLIHLCISITSAVLNTWL